MSAWRGRSARRGLGQQVAVFLDARQHLVGDATRAQRLAQQFAKRVTVPGGTRQHELALRRPGSRRWCRRRRSGLPSMSPPTQVPKPSTSGSRRRLAIGSPRAHPRTPRRTPAARGTARPTDRSRRARTRRRRSASPARPRRSASRRSAPGACARRSARCSYGVRLRSMSSIRQVTICRSFSSSARRTASVGCAVNTGSMRRRGSSATTSSRLTPCAASEVQHLAQAARLRRWRRGARNRGGDGCGARARRR